MNKTKQHNQPRRGMLALELVAVLPVVAVVVCGLVELAMLLAAASQVSTAASAAAREASLPGASTSSVEQAAQMALKEASYGNQCEVMAKLVEPSLQHINISRARSGDMIQVRVTLPAKTVCPDLLRFVGLTLEDRTLTSCFVVRRE